MNTLNYDSQVFANEDGNGIGILDWLAAQAMKPILEATLAKYDGDLDALQGYAEDESIVTVEYDVAMASYNIASMMLAVRHAFMDGSNSHEMWQFVRGEVKDRMALIKDKKELSLGANVEDDGV